MTVFGAVVLNSIQHLILHFMYDIEQDADLRGHDGWLLCRVQSKKCKMCQLVNNVSSG